MNATKNTHHYCLKNAQGFTLVELMITLAISGIIVAAIYAAYISQQRTYLAQEQVAEMQQNIRAAVDLMAREIRSAGYDPTGKAGAVITTASAGQISFSQDINGDGDTADTGEIIDFGFSAAPGYDVDRNGIPDTATNGIPNALSLGMQTGGAGGYQPIADQIQAIEFYYTMADGTATLAPASLVDIRTVQISILARAGLPDRDFTNSMTYTTASGATWGSPYNDNFRRRLLITAVECRNMGL